MSWYRRAVNLLHPGSRAGTAPHAFGALLILLPILFLGCTHARGDRRNAATPGAPADGVVEALVKAEVVTLPCSWPAGATFDYEFTRRRTDTRKPEIAGLSTITTLSVEVLQGGNPAHLVWRPGETRVEGPEGHPGLMAPTSSDELYGPPMLLEFTDGYVTGLLNHPEVLEGMEPIVRGMTHADPPEIYEQTMAMMSHPETGPAVLTRDAVKFFSMHCVEMEVGQVFSAPVEWPNPFGGPPLPATSSVALVAHDREAGTVTIETLDVMDTDAIRDLVMPMLERFVPGADLADEELNEVLAQLPPIESTTTGAMIYSVADGFPLQISVRQDIGAGDHPMHRSDTWIWTRTGRR